MLHRRFGIACTGFLLACGSGEAEAPTGAPAGTAGTSVTAQPEDTAQAGGSASEIDTSVHSYDADDANIRYSGRIDRTDPKQAVYASPGVAVTAHFRGDGISAILGDEFRYGQERGFHDVIVDGQITKKIALEQGVDRYELASGLSSGEHTVSIVKRTQASLGKSLFRGFEVNGELLPPAEPPALKIEFIGDSVTVAEGVEGVNGTADCKQNALGLPGGWGQPFHNGDRSYGVVTAEALDAEYHLTAASGIGVVRNYARNDARTMPDVYDLMFIEEMASAPWDHSEYVPDVVVVALGTNDFSGGDAPPTMPRPKMDVAMYTEAYSQFVSKLRGYYPDAQIFALTSQLLSDNGASTPATDLQTALAAVAQRFSTNGDAKVHSFVTTRVQGLGCTGHPNVEQQTQLGQELATEIRSVIGL